MAGRPMSATRAVEVPLELLARLAPHAGRRRMTTEALLRLLIELALEDGLVDAVMDDGVAAPPAETEAGGG